MDLPQNGNLDAHDEKWRQKFEALRLFRDTHGRYPRRNTADREEHLLGKWVDVQRCTHGGTMRGRHSEYRMAALEALPGWEWVVYKGRVDWDTNFDLLSDFLVQNGRFPDQRSSDVEERRLYNWIGTQRSVKNGTTRGNLGDDRQARLETLPGWSWGRSTPIHRKPWSERHKDLCLFVEHTGRFPRYGPDFSTEESKLARWMSNQRQSYVGTRQAALTSDQVRALETIPGWSWRAIPRREKRQSWDQRLQELELFLSTHVRYPSASVDDEKSLAQWVYGQRRRYKAKKLSDERIGLLEAVEGWSWSGKAREAESGSASEPRAVSDRWGARLSELTAFIERERRYPILSDEKVLYQWIQVQRHAYKTQKLSDERIGLLEAVEGWSWSGKVGAEAAGAAGELHPVGDRWGARLSELTAFIERERRYPHPSTEKSLYVWIQTQRQAYKTRNLSDERIGLLEAVEGWSWSGKVGAEVTGSAGQPDDQQSSASVAWGVSGSSVDLARRAVARGYDEFIAQLPQVSQQDDPAGVDGELEELGWFRGARARATSAGLGDYDWSSVDVADARLLIAGFVLGVAVTVAANALLGLVVGI